jgi:hypothetical protein
MAVRFMRSFLSLIGSDPAAVASAKAAETIARRTGARMMDVGRNANKAPKVTVAPALQTRFSPHWARVQAPPA